MLWQPLWVWSTYLSLHLQNNTSPHYKPIPHMNLAQYINTLRSRFHIVIMALEWLRLRLTRWTWWYFADQAYSPPFAAGHFSETTSPIYPDRPIRPLPKRRLRSRLPPDFAESILSQSTPTPTKPLFYLPFGDTAAYSDLSISNSRIAEADSKLGGTRQDSHRGRENGYQFKGNDLDSDGEEGSGVLSQCQGQSQTPASILQGSTNGEGRTGTGKLMKPPNTQSAPSSAESVDGYDSFENTNNKKKRKIPTSGTLGNHHSTLSAEMAHMGMSPSRDMDTVQESDGGVGQYYGTGSSAVPATSSGTGISGAGRGRYGRAGTRTSGGRSPLGVSMNGSNTLQVGRQNLQRRDYGSTGSLGSKGIRHLERFSLWTNIWPETAAMNKPDQGIISAAIANAATFSTPTPNGKENISLLDQQSNKKSSATKTQFTFTCESDSAKSIVWPGQQSQPPKGPHQTTPQSHVTGTQVGQGNRGVATQGTQTSPSMAGQAEQNGAQQPGGSQQAPQLPKKPRRPLVKQYAVAARQRRLQQDYNNYHHPLRPEDIWICEFCEYESIFGSPPEALVRQYEIKDRRERKRLAEKRRLLEKAKMKGRKGKKGNKNAAKNANAATQPHPPAQKQRYDQQPMDEAAMQHQGTQSEDYLEDDYDDDPIPTPAVKTQTPSKIPQPTIQNHNHSFRAATGSGGALNGSAAAGRAA